MFEANERHSQLTRSYRSQVAAEVYPNKLKEICGNTGTEGLYPFEVL